MQVRWSGSPPSARWLECGRLLPIIVIINTINTIITSIIGGG